MNLEEVKKQAIAELDKEAFRRAVEKYKFDFRNKRSIWDRLFPWKIIIIRKVKKNVRH